MIIQEQGDQLILIRQTDHAMLSGFFARALGNKVFSRPEPFESFCLAAAEHDNGWNEWELLPQIDSKTFTPYNFMSIPTEDHVALYQRGIERVVRVDRYAGLLVSMHCAGLYDRTRATMPGFSAKYVRSNESHIVTDFLQRLRLQQLRLKVDLRADPLMKHYCGGPPAASKSAATGSARSTLALFLSRAVGWLYDRYRASERQWQRSGLGSAAGGEQSCHVKALSVPEGSPGYQHSCAARSQTALRGRA